MQVSSLICPVFSILFLPYPHGLLLTDLCRSAHRFSVSLLGKFSVATATYNKQEPSVDSVLECAIMLSLIPVNVFVNHHYADTVSVQFYRFVQLHFWNFSSHISHSKRGTECGRFIFWIGSEYHGFGFNVFNLFGNISGREVRISDGLPENTTGGWIFLMLPW